MIEKLSAYYYQPQHFLHRAGQSLIAHFSKISTACALVLLAYPLGLNVYYRLPSQAERELPSHYETLARQQNGLAILREKQRAAFGSHNVAEINQHIKQILQRHQIHGERLQWQFEGSQTLSLTATQTSENLLNAIAELSRLPNLAFVEIAFTKLHQDRQVALNALLILTPSRSFE